MKKFILTAMCAITAIASLNAQTNIEKLYQRIASDPKIAVHTSIQVDRKPGADVTGKTSMCEINSFGIHKPDKKNRYRYAEYGRQYVTDLAAAIQAEATNPLCYRVASYNIGDRGAPRQWNLLYGDDASQYITIGENRGKNYIFACIIDEKNPGYRTCYALEWYEYEFGKDIFCKFMRLYAKMPTEANNEGKVSYNGKVLYDQNSFDEKILEEYRNLEPFFRDMKIDESGVTIFSLNGDKPIPLDSLDVFFAKKMGVDNGKGKVLSTILLPYHKASRAQRTKQFFQSFNALTDSWMKGDYQTNSTLPVSIYTIIKDAVEADLLNKDEMEFVTNQLASMLLHADDENETAINYLLLAQKLLQQARSGRFK